MDLSFELLSTMLPKIANTNLKQTSSKSPSKLSLKKYFRRSSLFDRKPNINNSVIIVEDSASDNDSSFNSSTNKNIQNSFKSCTDNVANWLAANTRMNDCSQEDVFEISDNCLQKTPVKNNGNINEFKRISTSVETNFGNLNKSSENILDQLYGELWRTGTCKTEPRQSKKFTEINISKTKKKLSKKILQSSFISDSNEVISSTSSSSRSSPTITDKILCKTEPRKHKKYEPIYFPKSERKPKQTAQSPWIERLKNLCDEDSFEDSIRKELNFDSDKESDDDVKEFSKSSDECNFSDCETDSLKTRLLKKSKHNVILTDVQIKTFKKTDNRKKVETSKVLTKEATSTRKRNTESSKKKTDSRLNGIKDKKGFLVSEVTPRKYSFLKSLSGAIPLLESDPSALFYRQNFQSQKHELAKKLFNLYNETIFQNALPDDFEIEWSVKMLRTAGFCYNKKIKQSNGTLTRISRIVLGTKIVDTADRLRDTLVHEMCHAATWIVDNVGKGHESHWKLWAYKAMKTYPELPMIKRCHNYEIVTKYTYKCRDCGYSFGRHSKSLDIERKCCGYCYGKLEIFINKVTKKGEKQSTLATPKGKPTGFALYVKENYSKTKRDFISHGEVMKILGQQFKMLKIENS